MEEKTEEESRRENRVGAGAGERDGKSGKHQLGRKEGTELLRGAVRTEFRPFIAHFRPTFTY